MEQCCCLYAIWEIRYRLGRRAVSSLNIKNPVTICCSIIRMRRVTCEVFYSCSTSYDWWAIKLNWPLNRDSVCWADVLKKLIVPSALHACCFQRICCPILKIELWLLVLTFETHVVSRKDRRSESGFWPKLTGAFLIIVLVINIPIEALRSRAHYG